MSCYSCSVGLDVHFHADNLYIHRSLLLMLAGLGCVRRAWNIDNFQSCTYFICSLIVAHVGCAQWAWIIDIPREFVCTPS